MSEIRFSLVTALYTKSDPYLASYFKHLDAFVKEVKSQNISFEIIFVPQVPTPYARNLLGQFSHEPWFRMRELPKPGLYSAWNAGVREARGKVVGFWNVDDIRFMPAVLEAERLAKRGFEIMYFPFTIKRYIPIGPLSVFVGKRNIAGVPFERRQFETGMPCGPHFMFTKEAYEKVGPFDEQFKIVADFDWCARAAHKGLQFGLGSEYSGIFRIDSRGLSAGKNDLRSAENNIVALRNNAPEKIIPGVEKAMQQYRVDQLLYQGSWQKL